MTWPDSDEYRQLFVDLLYMMTRGRWYDERTGVVVDAQAAGWQIFDANYPPVACGAGDDDSVTLPRDEYERLIEELENRCRTGGAMIIESEDEMGQVVTDVTYEDGVLYVHFGPCCKRAVTDMLDCCLEAPIEPGDGDDLPDDFQPSVEDWSCRDATAVVQGMVSILAEVNDILETTLPPFWVKEFNDRLPWVQRSAWRTFNALATYKALSEVAGLVALGDDGPTLTAYEQSTAVCRLRAGFDGANGISDDDFNAIDNVVKNVLVSFGSLEAGWVDNMLTFPARAGYDRLVKQQRWTSEPVCDCPGELDYTGGGDVRFTREFTDNSSSQLDQTATFLTDYVMRRDITANATDSYKTANFDAPLDADDAVTSLTIVIVGDYHSEDWSDTCPQPLENRAAPKVSALSGDNPTSVVLTELAIGTQVVYTWSSAQTLTKLSHEFGYEARPCPIGFSSGDTWEQTIYITASS